MNSLTNARRAALTLEPPVLLKKNNFTRRLEKALLKKGKTLKNFVKSKTTLPEYTAEELAAVLEEFMVGGKRKKSRRLRRRSTRRRF